MHPYWGIQVANGQRNKDGNIIISKVAPNLHQTGEVQKKENPETIAVSGFLKFLIRNRLSLGAVIRHVKTVFTRENRGIE